MQYFWTGKKGKSFDWFAVSVRQTGAGEGGLSRTVLCGGRERERRGRTCCRSPAKTFQTYGFSIWTKSNFSTTIIQMRRFMDDEFPYKFAEKRENGLTRS
ncbi:hypothetical protein GWI33_013033 [Rhynchophorus ferrugineus]|uniref:Uncharacterized protein n=1 Tax=Rhynchophorus ferrugineus TaxID=354439 RepID=A0A834MAC5_RHYFE|nr:hypothetical protein GWI33_013033 [Rhynchophorus ferrugineus]